MSEAVLRVEGLRKRFGGLLVSDEISLEVGPDELHALIGPNGAGKTSLINQLSGLTRPDAGRIVFLGSDITRLRAHERARLGLARSFQVTSVLPGFTTFENVALSAQGRAGGNFRFLADASNDPSLNDEAAAALREVGLDHRAGTRAGELSHGERRMLELAIALAMKPKLLLLDEPAAGTSAEESSALAALLGRLKRRLPMLLIEHDMNIVFALADRVSVLMSGRILASGAPQEVRADPRVIAAYLGETA